MQLFHKIFLVLDVPYQRDAWKKLQLPKLGKGCLKFSYFYGSHSRIDGILYVKQISLGSGRTLKKY